MTALADDMYILHGIHESMAPVEETPYQNAKDDEISEIKEVKAPQGPVITKCTDCKM